MYNCFCIIEPIPAVFGFVSAVLLLLQGSERFDQILNLEQKMYIFSCKTETIRFRIFDFVWFLI